MINSMSDMEKTYKIGDKSFTEAEVYKIGETVFHRSSIASELLHNSIFGLLKIVADNKLSAASTKVTIMGDKTYKITVQQG